MQLRVIPRTNWLNGTAPLEVFIQFSKSDDESRTIAFDALCALIERPVQSLASLMDSDAISTQPIELIPLMLTAIMIVVSIANHLKKRR